jgi:hypothetical protein
MALVSEFCNCPVFRKLILSQRERIDALTEELATHEENGDEYHMHECARELIAAKSPARLIHKCEKK